MDQLIEIVFAALDPRVRDYILLGLAFATVALPVFEWIAERTSWTWDNKAVAFLKLALSKIPRVRLGNKPSPSRMSAPTVPETPSAKAEADLGS